MISISCPYLQAPIFTPLSTSILTRWIRHQPHVHIYKDFVSMTSHIFTSPSPSMSTFRGKRSRCSWPKRLGLEISSPQFSSCASRRNEVFWTSYWHVREWRRRWLKKSEHNFILNWFVSNHCTQNVNAQGNSVTRHTGLDERLWESPSAMFWVGPAISHCELRQLAHWQCMGPIRLSLNVDNDA